MTVEQRGVVDLISFDRDADEVSLGIVDHLTWCELQPDHLMLLQEKLNSYIEFIESGQLAERPEFTAQQAVVIKVFANHHRSVEAKRFYTAAEAFLRSRQVELRFEHRPTN